MKDFIKYIGEYKKYVFLTLIFICLESVADAVVPYITGRFFDVVIVEKAGGFTKYVILMLLAVFITLVGGWLNGVYSAKASVGFVSNIRLALFNKIQDFSFANIDKFSTASLLTRIGEDVYKVMRTFTMIIRGGVRTPILTIGSFIMVMFINPKISIIFLVAIPVLSVILYILFKIAHPRFEMLMKKVDELNLVVQENLTAIRIVKAFVREDFEIDKFNEKADDLRKSSIYAEKIAILNFPAMRVVVSLCAVFILWFGGKQVIAGKMKIGELSAIMIYIMQILNSLMRLSFIFVSFFLTKISRDRIMEVINEEPTIKDGDMDAQFQDGSFEFNNVFFKYNENSDNYILKDINLMVKSGETIGIIGGTGSGKSSLIQLLLRLYDISSGSLTVGGNDIKNYKLKTLRNNISVVLQKNLLFSGTIKENLLWGNETATDEEIIEVCKMAEAHEFIMSFENGYDTFLDQAGVNLSGGQKQRLCIARALLKKAKILILDDSTSAVDTATDAKIRQMLKNKIPDTTKVIISQRILSIMNCDKIIVIDAGKINAIGNHRELLNSNDIYREIYTSQQSGENN